MASLSGIFVLFSSISRPQTSIQTLAAENSTFTRGSRQKEVPQLAATCTVSIIWPNSWEPRTLIQVDSLPWVRNPSKATILLLFRAPRSLVFLLQVYLGTAGSNGSRNPVNNYIISDSYTLKCPKGIRKVGNQVNHLNILKSITFS